MQFQDYYKTLGVSREATADEIRKAYRKLARKYHPDISKEPDAEARMKEINEANTVLSDPEKRAAYDQLGQGPQAGHEFRPPPGWDSGFEFSTRDFSSSEAAEFSDFFAQLFGRMGGAGGKRQGFHSRAGGAAARGEDHHAKVMLDIEDAFVGATRQINLRVPRMNAQGQLHIEERSLQVKIPPGVREGQLIRLAGQGSPGLAAGAAGDLLLEVHFKPHARYRLDERDLHMTLPVAPWEAALGAIVELNLPTGSLRVRIPEGAQSGRELRVPGRGLPGKPPGDLRLAIQVILPPADTPRARELYERMARELPFDPRRTSGDAT